MQKFNSSLRNQFYYYIINTKRFLFDFYWKMVFKEMAIFILILLLAIQGRLSGLILYTNELVRQPGEHADFNFTTKHGNPIIKASWGLKGNGNKPKTVLIVVTKLHGIQCGLDLNTTEGMNYKNRVYFTGNITKGHAWFRITKLLESDTKEYIFEIRENTKRIGKMYVVKLVVTKKNVSLSEKTPPTDFQSRVTTLKATVGTIVDSSMDPPTKFDNTTDKNLPELIKVNRDPPTSWIGIATVIVFLYAVYTLVEKTNPQAIQSLKDLFRKIRQREGK